MTLDIAVERVEFDAEQCSLRINGRNSCENEFVKMGQYHTIDIEVGQSFTIVKDCWDTIYLETLAFACDVSNVAEVAAVVMQEGYATICLITPAMTLTRAVIEHSLPRKKTVFCHVYIYMYILCNHLFEELIEKELKARAKRLSLEIKLSCFS